MAGECFLVALDVDGGQAVFRSGDAWFRVCIDDEWKPQRLNNVRAALRFAITTSAEAMEIAFPSLDQLVAFVRDRWSESVATHPIAVRSVLHLLPEYMRLAVREGDARPVATRPAGPRISVAAAGRADVAPRSKNHVLLIHGFGHHTSGWSLPWQACLRENATLFSPYAKDPGAFDRDVVFAEVTYGKVFENDYRQRWQGLVGALADTAIPLSVRTVIEGLSQADDARLTEFLWTHVLDGLLWYAFGQARQAVIATVATQVGEALKRAMEDEANVHILAHSLGTSVAHDTLLCLAAGKKTRGIFDPAHGGCRWSSYVTVANLSLLLAARESPSDDLDVEAFQANRSRVRVGDLVKRFVNVQHAQDALTLRRSFKPDWDAKLYSSINVDRFDAPGRTHEFATHIDNPVAARACLRLFTGRMRLGNEVEMAKAWLRYERKYGRRVGKHKKGIHNWRGPRAEMPGLIDAVPYLFEYARLAAT